MNSTQEATAGNAEHLENGLKTGSNPVAQTIDSLAFRASNAPSPVDWTRVADALAAAGVALSAVAIALQGRQARFRLTHLPSLLWSRCRLMRAR